MPPRPSVLARVAGAVLGFYRGVLKPLFLNAVLVWGCYSLVRLIGGPHGELLALILTTVLFIIFGPRFEFEHRLDEIGIPGREAWSAVAALAVAMRDGWVTEQVAWSVFDDKIEIIALIMSFATISEGLARCGYFEYAAFHVAEKCRGSTHRMVLYMFVLASVLTLFTSNDIVVLVLTPILLSISVQAKLYNPKLLLLSQFVAANTLSMGLLIGSPTNMILGQELQLDFLRYLALMVVPAVLSFYITFTVVNLINRWCSPERPRRHAPGGDWQFESSYEVPTNTKHRFFSTDMKYWLGLFALAVLVVVVFTYLKTVRDVPSPMTSLLWASAVIGGAALYLYFKRNTRKLTEPDVAPGIKLARRLTSTAAMVLRLPFGILFFGMSFFILTRALNETPFVTDVVVPFLAHQLTQNAAFTGVTAIATSGLLVNIFNDLPTSALLADVVNRQVAMEAIRNNELIRNLTVQGFLVGLNIGCYVTPIGALAGIIWFNLMGRIKKELAADNPELADRLKLPTRTDLVYYGVIHFAFSAAYLGIILPFLAILVDWFVAPAMTREVATNAMQSFGRTAPIWWLGGGLLIFTIAYFLRVSRKQQLALANLGEVFAFLTSARVWALRHKFWFSVLITTTVLALSAGALYMAEVEHARLYGDVFQEAQDKSGQVQQFGVRGFITWFIVLVGSGYEMQMFPRSQLGLLIAGVMPLVFIYLIIAAFRSVTTFDSERATLQVASGDIPVYRCFVFNYQASFDRFVANLFANPSSFVTVFAASEHLPAAHSLARQLAPGSGGGARIHVAEIEPDIAILAQRYNVQEAAEVYLLSDYREETEFQSIRLIQWLDSQRDRAFSGLPFDGDSGEADTATIVPAGVSKLPQIVVELINLRTLDRLQRSISSTMHRHLLRIDFSARLAAEFLAADAGSIEAANKFYRFGRFFEDQVPRPWLKSFPLSSWKLSEFALDEPARTALVRAFAVDETSMHTHSLRETGQKSLERLWNSGAIGYRLPTPGAGQAVRTAQLPAERFYGVSISCGSTRLRLSAPSAAVAAQTAGLDGIVALEAAGGDAPSSLGGAAGRILIVNTTPTSLALIDLLADGAGNAGRIVVFTTRESHASELRARHADMVQVVTLRDMTELGDHLLPDPGMPGAKASAALRAGDRVYFFAATGAEHANAVQGVGSDLRHADIIDALLARLQPIADGAHPAGASDWRSVYLAAEATTDSSRFLFEHALIDEVFSTSWFRHSMYECLAWAYHHPQAEHGTRQEFEKGDQAYRIAFAMAAFLSRYVVLKASDMLLPTEDGGRTPLVGRSLAECNRLVRAFHSPPLQVVGALTFGVETAGENTGMPCLRSANAAIGSPDPVTSNDFLLCLPML